MYPAYLAVAQLQDEGAARRSGEWALAAEKIHAAMYLKAKQAAETGKDVALKDVYICPICGHTVEGGAPDKCPVCGALKAKFVKF
jgi:rubrerythrin